MVAGVSESDARGRILHLLLHLPSRRRLENGRACQWSGGQNCLRIHQPHGRRRIPKEERWKDHRESAGGNGWWNGRMCGDQTADISVGDNSRSDRRRVNISTTAAYKHNWTINYSLVVEKIWSLHEHDMRQFHWGSDNTIVTKPSEKPSLNFNLY